MQLKLSTHQTTVMTVGVPPEADAEKLQRELYYALPDGYPMPRLKDGIVIAVESLAEHLDDKEEEFEDSTLEDFFRSLMEQKGEADEFIFIPA